MAEEERQEEQEERSLYVFKGPGDVNLDNSEVIDMLDGRRARVGEEIELSDEEAKAFRSRSLKLTKVSEEEVAERRESGAEAPHAGLVPGNLGERSSSNR